MLCRAQHEISLTVLLANYHDVINRIFQQKILCQTGMKSPLKWHNQPGKEQKSFKKSREGCGYSWEWF